MPNRVNNHFDRNWEQNLFPSTVVDGGEDFTSGHIIYFDKNSWSNEQGDGIGTIFGNCKTLQTELMCNINMVIDDIGEMAMRGLYTSGMVVTGGKGCFTGATGVITGAQINGSFKYEVDVAMA